MMQRPYWKPVICLAAAAGAAFFLMPARLPVAAAQPARPAAAPRTIDVTVHEGTSMAIALSPDKRTLILDLQGSLWSVPASGGAAKRITDEYNDARQPSWSPDGSRIAFQSYRDGTWRIVTVAPDGSGMKALTDGPFDDARTALVARRQVDRLFLRPQRQLRRLDPRRRERPGSSGDERSGQRFLPGLVARRPRDRVRLESHRRRQASTRPRSTARSASSHRPMDRSARRRGRRPAAKCSSPPSPATGSPPPAPRG